MSDFEQLVKSYQRIRKRSAEIDKALGEICTELERKKDRAPALLKNLKLAADYFTDLNQNAHELGQALLELKTQIEPHRTGYGAHLGGQISEQLSTRLNRNLNGNYPWWQDGSFWIEVDESQAIAKIWYGKEQEHVDTCPLDATKIVDALENSRKTLCVHGTESEFVNRIDAAFGAIERSKSVPIIALMNRVAWELQSSKFKENPSGKLFRDYSRAQFSYEISRFKAAFLAVGYHLVVASKQNTRSRADFLWIPDQDSGNGQCYAFVEKKERVGRDEA